MPTPVQVTGTMQTLTGGQIAQGTVTFQLANIGIGTIPRIIGIGEFPALKIVVMTDQQGNISTPLWGNDAIDPANTIYLVTFRDFLGNEVGPVQFSINGVAVNLNTLTPTNTVLPPILTSFGFATGTNLVAGNFLLTGWGIGATITAIHGTQMGCHFTITAGTGPTISPTVTLTFPTAYPFPPLSMAQLVGGTGAVSDISIVTNTTQAIFTYNGLPTATQTYTFAVFELGLGN